MKQILLTLATALTIAGAAQAKELQEKISIKNFPDAAVNTYAEKSFTSKETGVTYTLQFCKANEANGSGLQFRSKNNNSGMVITSNPKDYKVVKVTVDRSTENTSNNQLDFYSSEKAYTAASDLYAAASAGTLVGNVAKNESGTVTLETPAGFIGMRSNNGACYINSVTVVYEVPDDVTTKEEAILSFPEASYKVVFGKEFTAPELTINSTGAVTYSSSDPEVATVDATTGAVTVTGMGKTVITANSAENDEYYAGTASYTLIVSDPDAIYENSLMDNSCEFTFDQGTNGKDIWTIDSTYGLKATAYFSGKPTEASAEAISPIFDLTSYEAPIELSFYQAANQFKIDDVMVGSTDECSKYLFLYASEPDDPTYFLNEVKLTWPASFSWNYTLCTVNLDEFAGKKLQLRFSYNSNTSIAGTWEIKDMKLTAKYVDPSAVATIGGEDAKPVFYDLQGRRVENPAKGLYIRVASGKASKVIMK